MRTHWIELQGRTFKVVLEAGARPVVDGVALEADVRELQPGVLSILLTGSDGRTRSFTCVDGTRPEGPAVVVEGLRLSYAAADPRSLRTSQAAQGDAGPRPLKAPMPGRIVRVLVAEGEAVESGQGCVVIEAMKMQNELKAPKAGTVSRLAARVGETVGANAVLLVVE